MPMEIDQVFDNPVLLDRTEPETATSDEINELLEVAAAEQAECGRVSIDIEAQLMALGVTINPIEDLE